MISPRNWKWMMIATVTVAASLLLASVALGAVSVTPASDDRAPVALATPATAEDGSQACIACHESLTPKVIEQYRQSQHAGSNGATCMDCHEAEKGDWDATQHNGFLIGTHPTPKDCSRCHEKEVSENMASKHAIAQLRMSQGGDRNKFEPPIATKHGCEQCHQIGNYWPDGSIGECDACHSKHRFDLAEARNPQTCGECHMGPDHPNIETYMESKHGNIYATRGHEWKLDFEPSDGPIPIEAPTCTTCHMDGAPGVKPTHNVSARLAWETQAPWSLRTTWGGQEWQDKREAMETICGNCHAPPFTKRYFLEADLAILQYNQIYKAGADLLAKMKEADLLKTPDLGWDEPPERDLYYIWHHQGRRFRQGAIMMGADYTQWHGIWELQENLIDMMNWAGDHGLKEAQAWQQDDSPLKFLLYPWYDVPGTAWGISAISNRNVWFYDSNNVEDYWKRAYANTEAAYKAGLLSDDQWALYEKLYENREEEMGLTFDLPPENEEFLAGLKKDKEAVKQVQELELPGEAGWVFGK